MVLTSIFILMVIGLDFSMIHHCLSMVIPTTFSSTIALNIPRNKTTSPPTHILHVRIGVHDSLIETLVNEKQLKLIEIQLQQRRIPYREIQDHKHGITIIIGPFHKSFNLTINNQSRFHTNFTKILPIKTQTIDSDKQQIPMIVEAQTFNLAVDQESYEFRNCLKSCEIYEHNELKPDHNCIRTNCLKDITGI